MNNLYYNSKKYKMNNIYKEPIKEANKEPIKELIKDQTNDFIKIYGIKNKSELRDPKIQFRYLCYKYLNHIQKYKIPDIYLGLSYEAVLVEFRCFPHIEFIIRNNIIKLGSDWSFSVVCGKLNFDFMTELCGKISKNIKIIKTNYDNLLPSDYSRFLASLDFWNLLVGDKIIIYQEDSIIFKNNINDFIKWDYIGAPFPKKTNSTPNGVGNGGLSLRSKQTMIDVINKISIENTVVSKSVQNYMKRTNSYCNPEDIYFCQNMIEYNIGNIADWDSAYEFSSESICNPNSFGGHIFWISDTNWKERFKKQILINI